MAQAGRQQARPAPGRTIPARQAPGGPPAKLTLAQVTFKEPTPGGTPTPSMDMPDDWKDSDEVKAAGQFYPTADWRKPGEYFEGILLGVSPERGPNKQRLYHLQHSGGDYFDCWGTTAIDDRIDQLMNSGVLTTGMEVRVTYLGEAPTARNQNPVKLFDVRCRPGKTR